MSEKVGNIRAYGVGFADGKRAFEHKDVDGRAAMGCGSVRTLALNVRSSVKAMLESGYSTVGIDFIPFHNIDCPQGLEPRFCSPLTAAEQAMFWDEYLKE